LNALLDAAITLSVKEIVPEMLTDLSTTKEHLLNTVAANYVQQALLRVIQL
jgi:hypothetical protein